MHQKILLAPVLLMYISATSQSSSTQALDVMRSASTMVTVPALVRARSGAFMEGLAVDDFVLSDNGVRQRVNLSSTDRDPIALVVVLQTGGTASRHFLDYVDLPPLLGWLLGGTDHEIMLVTFDSRVEMTWHFPFRSDGVNYSLSHLRPGDTGAAMIDAVQFGVEQLQSEPGSFRRIVLLVSQEKDAGSSTLPEQVLRTLGKGSTAVYSLTFREPKSKPKTRRGSGAQEANPLAAALDRLNQQSARELADYTGGAHFSFSARADFDEAVKAIAADIHHRYALSFQPTLHEPGYHRITLRSKDGLSVYARAAYWFEALSPTP